MADESIFSGILKGIERTPGNIVGAPVDITNMVMGAIAGKGMDGFVQNPVGGSESINSVFGLGNSDKTVPTSQSITELLAGFVNPGSAAKSMIIGLPAAMRIGSAMDDFAEMSKAGASAAKTFKETKIFEGGVDKLLRTTLSDAPMTIKRDAFVNYDGKLYLGGAKKLSQVIDHPKLFEQYPDFKDINVDVMQGKPGEAAFNPALNTIFLAGDKDLLQLRNPILHELQHAVQKKEGFSRGSSINAELGGGADIIKSLQDELDTVPIEDPKRVEILDKIKKLKDGATNRYLRNPGEQEARFTGERNMDTTSELNAVIEELLRRGKTTQNYMD